MNNTQFPELRISSTTFFSRSSNSPLYFVPATSAPMSPTSSRAVAICGTRVLQLDRETLEAMCCGEPAIAIRMIRVLVSRLIEAERRLASLGVDDLLRPVVRGLIREAETDPEHGYRIPSTLRSLAEECGLSMLETHRALHQLFDNKVIRLIDDCLYANDLDAISACLEPQKTA